MIGGGDAIAGHLPVRIKQGHVQRKAHARAGHDLPLKRIAVHIYNPGQYKAALCIDDLAIDVIDDPAIGDAHVANCDLAARQQNAAIGDAAPHGSKVI